MVNIFNFIKEMRLEVIIFKINVLLIIIYYYLYMEIILGVKSFIIINFIKMFIIININMVIIIYL